MTIRVDEHVLTWARARAFFGGTSLNALVRRFLEEYAAVPARWMDGLPPPWTAENRIRPVMDPIGAGSKAAGRAGSGELGGTGLSDLLDSAMAEALAAVPAAPEKDSSPRQG